MPPPPDPWVVTITMRRGQACRRSEKAGWKAGSWETVCSFWWYVEGYVDVRCSMFGSRPSPMTLAGYRRQTDVTRGPEGQRARGPGECQMPQSLGSAVARLRWDRGRMTHHHASLLQLRLCGVLEYEYPQPQCAGACHPILCDMHPLGREPISISILGLVYPTLFLPSSSQSCKSRTGPHRPISRGLGRSTPRSQTQTSCRHRGPLHRPSCICQHSSSLRRPRHFPPTWTRCHGLCC